MEKEEEGMLSATNQHHRLHTTKKKERRFERLYRLHHCYQERWTHDLLKRLAKDLVTARIACTHENLSGTIDEIEDKLLFPLAEICLMQYEELISLRKKLSANEKKHLSTIISLQDEKREIKMSLTSQNAFVETLLLDFEKMANKVELISQKHRDLEKVLELLLSDRGIMVSKLHSLKSNSNLIWDLLEDGTYGIPAKSLSCEGFKYEEEEGSNAGYHFQNCLTNLSSSCGKDASFISLLWNDDEMTRRHISEEKLSITSLLLQGILDGSVTSVTWVMENGIHALPSALSYFWIGVFGGIIHHASHSLSMFLRHFPAAFSL